MPHVSRRKLAPRVYQEIIESLQWVLSEIKTKREVEEFLSDLLSNTEKLMLAKRLAVVLMIERGYSDTDIDEALKVSRTTIAKMRMWLSLAEGKGYKKAISKLVRREKMKQFWQLILDVLENPSPMLPKKSDMKGRAKLWRGGDGY